ncbi:MAG: hypothetical protein Q8K91_12505 [Hylemonella sp.]|nr:hypothetical protein [Hylemonella sp.]MDP1938020.1 hypothetical protein [Hylemonella sp.]
MEISSTTLIAREAMKTQATQKKPEEDMAVKLQQQKRDAEAQMLNQEAQPKPVVNTQGQTTGRMLNVTA